MQTILISLPIFLIIFSGWIFKKINIVKKDWVSVLNSFAYYIALPSLIISSFWSVNFLSHDTWIMIFESVAMVILFCVFVFAILSLFKIDKNTKNTILLGSIVGNTVFLGFPLVNIYFGKEYLGQSALVGSFLLIIPIILVIIFIQYQNLSSKISLKKELLEIIKNPLIIAVIIGILFSFLNSEYIVFESIKKTISILGSTASPVALFALGAFLHSQSKKSFNISILISFFKLILFPLMAILVSIYVFKNSDIKVLMMLSSMPVAVTTFVIAERFGLDEKLIGDSILISTILSFIVIPILIYIFL